MNLTEKLIELRRKSGLTQQELAEAVSVSRQAVSRWEVGDARFIATIRIEGIDRQGILHELISLISTHLSLDIRDLDIHADKEVFQCDLSLLVSDVAGVNSLCSKVRKISGVQKVTRL